MKAKLVALSFGIAMLGGAGIASAETKAPVATPANAQLETAKVTPSRSGTPVALTDEQMGKVTAGHRWYETVYNTNWHWGYTDIYISGYGWYTSYAYHRG